MIRLKRVAAWVALSVALVSTAVLHTSANAAPASIVVLSVGDSIVAGATEAGSTSDGFHRELGTLLDISSVVHEFVVDAEGGKPCSYWTSRMAGLVATHQPDLVLINCGTNDNPSDAAKTTAFENTYRGLLNAALTADPDVLVFPSWIQYSAVPPAGAWLRVSEPKVNDAIYRVVTSHAEWHRRIPTVLDFQSIPEGYLDSGGVHPTAGGYDVMGRLIFNYIAASLWLTPAPVPCGLVGRRFGGVVPAYVPCQTMHDY